VGGCKVHQRYQDTKETDNVDNENDDFDSRQRPTHEDVDEYREHQYSPQKECSMPALSLESRRVVESDELQNKICDKEAYRRECCYPANHGEPACTVQSGCWNQME
jgi:hypothetical protein